MSSQSFTFPGRLTFLLALAFIAAVNAPARAQDANPHGATVTDWSSKHLIFSEPGSERGAIEKGQYDHWWKIASDPRYQMQQRRRHHEPGPPRDIYWQKQAPGPHRDWAFSLGTGTVAQNQSPAKFSFNANETLTTASCTSDYVVYGLNVAGSNGAVGHSNMVAIDNLYAGTSPTGFCGTAPTLFWAYNVSTHGGAITTSPTISNDATGSKIIFVESVSGGSYVHVLVWNSSDKSAVTGSSGNPVTPPTNSASTVAGCAAGSPQPSCLVSFELKTTAGTPITSSTVTNSSPYYDYASDTLYVGDDAGHLFKVAPVLGTGTPAVTGLTVSSGNKLTAPVYDSNSGYVFVGASNGVLYAVTASNLTLPTHSSIQIGDAGCTNGGLIDSPVVDGTQGYVYEASMTGTDSTHTVVVQAYTSATPNGTTGNKNYPGGTSWSASATANVGEGDTSCDAGATFYAHAPEFDNAYYTSPGTGHLLAGGADTNPSSDYPAFWTVNFSGTPALLHTPTEFTGTGFIPQNPNTNEGEISPLTEIYNGTTDYVFAGVGRTGSYGALYGFTVSGGTLTRISGEPVTYPNAQGGTSGIVVDNVSGANQASSIYFTTLGTATGNTPCATGTYCAVKLTQAGLE